MLEQIKANSSGSTGRKRLSVSKFLSTRLPLPTIEDQRRYVNKIIDLRKQKENLEKSIQKEIERFNNTIFES